MSNQEPNSRGELTRRQFLRQVGSAAAAAGVAGGVTGMLATGAGWSAAKAWVPQFGDYAASGAPGGLAVAEMQDHGAAVRAAVERLGGMGRFVHRGDRVVVKPNVGFDRPPWVGATTSPEVVAEVVRLCRQAGAAEVVVLDYPINDAAGCFERSGIGPAARAAGAKVLLPRAGDFRETFFEGERLKVWDAYIGPFLARRRLRVIGVPTAKTHARSVISGAMKNWYGLLGGPRSVLHQELETVLADLCGMMTPTLIVMDATRLLLRNGPTGGSRGDVKAAHRVLAGTDQVAIDTLTAEWLGKDPAEIEWLHLAAARGLGSMDYKSKLVRA